MLRALNENNGSIHPTKGAMGYCPNCGKGVRAYCGEIYTHHWKHLELEHCDSWSEKESEWHRTWKKAFPLDWQEVIIKKWGEQHIADIRNPSGTVLELQHSSISSETIRIREEFYEDMIWLLDAQPFKHNFHIYSLVRYQLRVMEDSYSNLIDWGGPENEDEHIIGAKKELEEIKRKISDLEWQHNRTKGSIGELQEKLKKPGTHLRKVLRPNNFYLRHQSGFKPTAKKEYEEKKAKIKSSGEVITIKSEKLEKIIDLEDCRFVGMEHFKYVGSARVAPRNFKRCCAIQKESGGTLFPEVRYFNSEWDFKQTATSPKYHLLIDPSDIVEGLRVEISHLRKERKNLKKEKRELFQTMEAEFLNFLQSNLVQTKKELQKIISETEKLQRKKKEVKTKIAGLKEEAKKRREASEKALIQQRRIEKGDIMKRYQGLYGYRWKHRRKSWDFSSMPIYLDFGPHIFKVLDQSTFRKISKDAFMDTFKNGGIP
ncbi:hypothetical protein [Flagellimonas flava]|uniref:competence protein CoiA n=1 Tax=Flagellimonas flava TaxID=570519 RepID=UPI003D65961F